MKYIRIFLGISLLCQCAITGYAQSSASIPEDAQDFGLTPRQAESLRTRWNRSQPVVTLYSADAQPVTGQPVYFGQGYVYVYTKTGLPAGGDWQKDIVAVPFSEIPSISLQRGGNWIQRSRTSRFYALKPAGTEMVGKAIKRLHNSAVYRDSIVAAADLTEAFSHSKVLRNVFPKKHLRISFGVSLGGDVVTGDVKESLSSTPLGEPDYGSGNTGDLELADIAFRIFNRYMIGWQYKSLPDYAYWNYYSTGEGTYFSYDNHVGLYEHRIYAEYALFSTDRYFTRPFEWTVGAGVNFARTEKGYYYYYDDYSDPDNIYTDFQEDWTDYRITGFHLKSLFHYFIVPGVSFYAGVEASFYETWAIPEEIISSGEQGGQITLPGYEINLNNFRFRAGVSIYL